MSGEWIMQVDDVPEYQEMRRALLELRKELSTSMADDILTRCEKAIHAVRDAAIQDTLANTKETEDGGWGDCQMTEDGTCQRAARRYRAKN